MKTIEEWFNLVKDEELKNKLLNYMDEWVKDNQIEKLSEAIHEGFFWDSTTEGFDYWDDIANKAELNQITII